MSALPMSFPWTNRRRLYALLLDSPVFCVAAARLSRPSRSAGTHSIPSRSRKTGHPARSSPSSWKERRRRPASTWPTARPWASAAGGGVWTANLSHAQLLFGYGPEDVNRNFVGFLKTFEGTTLNEQLNVFVDVLDENIPSVVVAAPASGVRSTRYVANI
jgi:hypothetical protein